MKINNWLKRQIAAISISLSNVEKNVLNQEGRSLDEDITKHSRHLQGSLADSLVHGEVTQEVRNLRWRMYKIIKNTKGKTLTPEKTDEDGDVYYGVKNSDTKAKLKNIKVDEYDDYDLEMVFNNDEIGISSLDAMNDYVHMYDEPIIGETNDGSISATHGEINATEYFALSKGEKPINIERNIAPKFFIERYTNKINIRRISDEEKLLEFYVSIYPDKYNKNNNLFLNEIKKLINNTNKKFSFLEISEINFITNNTLGCEDFLYYSYCDVIFDKVIEYNGYYVIKFKTKVLVDGQDILSDYVEKELEKKYERKEKK
jgi:hypothetical protein